MYVLLHFFLGEKFVGLKADHSASFMAGFGFEITGLTVSRLRKISFSVLSHEAPHSTREF